MNLINRGLVAMAIAMLCVAFPASAQDSSVLVQCPHLKGEGTELHPPGDPAIKCEHLVAGDGMVTMADDAGKKQYIFSFASVLS